MSPTFPMGVVLRTRYRIVRLLHQSRHANIYLVEDRHLPGHIWAVREMQLVAVEPMERRRMSAQFQSEAQQLSLLSHINLARVIDFFADGNNLYVVREYVNGSSLDQLLSARSSPLPEREATQIALQIQDALAFLWGRKQPAIERIAPSRPPTDRGRPSRPPTTSPCQRPAG